MALTQRYAFADRLFSNIGYSHNFGPFTRLMMRLGRLDLVQRVDPPQLCWDLEENSFVWLFPVERRSSALWDDVDSAIKEASQAFFNTCSNR